MFVAEKGPISVSVLLALTQVQAATVEVADNYFLGSSKISAVVPQAPDPVGPILTNIVNTVFTDISGSVSGSYRSPWQWTKSLDGVEYEPFGKFTSVQAGGSGEIAFGS